MFCHWNWYMHSLTLRLALIKDLGASTYLSLCHQTPSSHYAI